MHDALFEAVDQWATDDPDPQLIRLAGELGLDVKTFSACLASRKALERVVSDMYDAQGIVSVTPTFIGLYGGAGHVINGSLPVDRLESTIQGMLDKAQARQ